MTVEGVVLGLEIRPRSDTLARDLADPLSVRVTSTQAATNAHEVNFLDTTARLLEIVVGAGRVNEGDNLRGLRDVNTLFPLAERVLAATTFVATHVGDADPQSGARPECLMRLRPADPAQNLGTDPRVPVFKIPRDFSFSVAPEVTQAGAVQTYFASLEAQSLGFDVQQPVQGWLYRQTADIAVQLSRDGQQLPPTDPGNCPDVFTISVAQASEAPVDVTVSVKEVYTYASGVVDIEPAELVHVPGTAQTRDNVALGPSSARFTDDSGSLLGCDSQPV